MEVEKIFMRDGLSSPAAVAASISRMMYSAHYTCDEVTASSRVSLYEKT